MTARLALTVFLLGMVGCGDSDSGAKKLKDVDPVPDMSPGDDMSGSSDDGNTSDDLPTQPVVLVSPLEPLSSEQLNCEVVTDSISPTGAGVSYRYSWDADGSDQAINVPAVAASRTAPGQTWTCTVTPIADGQEGPSGSASVQINNQLPVTSAPTIDPAEPRTADTLRCVGGESSDPDGQEVSLSFTWSQNGSPTTHTTEEIAPDATAKGDEWRCTTTPNDGLDDGSPQHSQVVVIANTAPEPPVLQVSPKPTTSGGDLICEVGTPANDADGDELTYTFEWRLLSGTQVVAGPTLSASLIQRGQSWECSATANDGEDESPPASVEITIQNSPPEAPSVELLPASPTTSDNLQCVVNSPSQDADGDTVTYTYSWSRNGAPTAHNASTLLASATSRGESWTCQVTPNDGIDDGPAASATQTIENQAPSAPQIAVSPTTARTANDLTCEITALATDADGDTISYVYSWSINGTQTSLTAASVPASQTSKGQVWTCSVRANDGLLSGPEVTAQTTILNTAPGAPVVSVGPTNPDTTNNLNCAVETNAIDPDGDTLNYTYSWRRDGFLTAFTGATLSAANTARGQIWECSATAYDGNLSGPAATASVTIQNSAPTMPQPAISPTAPRTTNNLVCTVQTASSDPDGDPITYQYTWLRDGLATTENTQVVNASSTSKAQSWTCLLSATDGTATSSSGTQSVTILNSPPSAPSIAISPAQPELTDALICQITTASVDPDQDAITYTYEWRRNGQATNFTGTTVPSSATSDGETWECRVTPFDGEQAGVVAVTSVSLRPPVCGIHAKTYFNGVLTHEAQVERTLPNPAYFLMVMSSVNVQTMDAKVDDLEIRDGQGNVLYSDAFNALGAWKVYRGNLGSAGVSGGVAYGYSDWNIFGLTNTPFDSSTGFVVEADVYWSPVVSLYIFYWANTNPTSNLVNTQMLGGSHDTQQYAANNGPPVAAVLDNLQGGGFNTAPWSRPATGWHRMRVDLIPSCW